MTEQIPQQSKQESDPEQLQQDFERLTQIAQILKESGLHVLDRSISMERLKDPTAEMGFPVVRDGVDGIRVSYSKRRGLIVWFTNGFEDPEYPKRKEVTEKLKKAGLFSR